MQVDLVIHAKHIIPVEPLNVVLDEHAIALKDGKIVAILPSLDIEKKYQADEVVQLSNHVLVPGFINAHTHASMTLFRGLADDKPLIEWLSEDIWPAEGQFVSPEFVQHGTQHSIAEMIRGGTTCFNDMYFFPEETAKVCEQVGMRAVLGHILLDFPTKYASTPDEYFEKARSLHNSTIKESSLLYSAIAPHAPYTVGDASLSRANDISRELGCPVHVHLHETEGECHDSAQLVVDSMNCHKSTNACHPLHNFHQIGLLSSRLVAVHMTQLTDEEIKLVADTQTNVVHCPSSNMKLASGICRVNDLLKAGVNVALGTDGASSNNSLSMLQEMKFAAMLSKVQSRDCTAVGASTALRMATLNGATALGIERDVGSLEVGKWGDITAISLNSVEMSPMYNVISHIVYCAGRENVSDVWIAGKNVLKNRVLTTIDVSQTMELCQQWHNRIRDYHDGMSKA